MKKLFLFFALMLPLVLSGCSSSDEEDLSGTVWESHEVDGDYEYTITITFSKSTYSYVNIEKGDWDGDGKIETDKWEGVGTYVYDHPNIILKDLEEDGDTSAGTISGNKMTFSSDGETIIFTKK